MTLCNWCAAFRAACGLPFPPNELNRNGNNYIRTICVWSKCRGHRLIACLVRPLFGCQLRVRRNFVALSLNSGTRFEISTLIWMESWFFFAKAPEATKFQCHFYCVCVLLPVQYRLSHRAPARQNFGFTSLYIPFNLPFRWFTTLWMRAVTAEIHANFNGQHRW